MNGSLPKEVKSSDSLTPTFNLFLVLSVDPHLGHLSFILTSYDDNAIIATLLTPPLAQLFNY